MAKRARYQNRIELLQGTLDLLILQTLQWGPQHGYGIALAIQAGSSDVLRVDTGSLYPALHRLEKQRWISATSSARVCTASPPPAGVSSHPSGRAGRPWSTR
jgi:hypothetical protein